MWEKIYSSVVNVLDINQATLSGSCDIICVKRLDKLASSDSTPKYIYKSTPFHIRFGKVKLLKSREKVVSVYVNGVLSNLTMKLSSAGEAYFPKDIDDDEDSSSDEGSPVHSLTISSIDESTEHLSLKCDDIQEISSLIESSKQKSGMEDVCLAKSPNSNDAEYDPSSKDVSLRCIDCQKPLVNKQYNIAGHSTKTAVAAATTGVNDAKRDRLGADVDPVKSGNIMSQKAESILPNFEYGSDNMWNWVDTQIQHGRDGSILQLSLCGHLIFNERDVYAQSQFFSKYLVTWDAFSSDPSILYDPTLVACFGSRPPYYQAKVAIALIISWIVFNRPLSPSAFDMILKYDMDKPKERYWDLLFGKNKSDEHINFDSSRDGYKKNGPQIPNPGDVSSLNKPRKCQQSFKPTSEQLESLNLNPGPNLITFVVQSALQGIQSVKSVLYLWPHDAKIVISDVDGTITRSDLLGHLMPIVGKDWSHEGVAGLFSKISQNSYKVLYLTARAIGQSSYTKEYLFGLTQNKSNKLPEGPLFLSPDRLLISLKREVITKSAYTFKISTLNEIRSIFSSEHNPFYAGFGNNDSDRRAYTSVGVPEFRIFTINPRGVIRTSNSTYQGTYTSMTDIVQEMFPAPVDNSSTHDDQYNEFQYWNFPIQMEVVNDLDCDSSWNDHVPFNEMAP